jgi:rhodanese-related sulfurtransferase
LPGSVFPQELDAPLNLSVLTAPEVKYMLEQERLTLVNSLSRIEFEIQHIPGSINVAVTEMEQSESLPRDRSLPIAFYCMGPRCTYSQRATRKALEMGYRKAFWFQGGIPEWRRFNYPMDEDRALMGIEVRKLSPLRLQDILAVDSVYVLDVRPLWWAETDAVIVGSHFIPLVELDVRYRELPKERDIVIIDGAMMQSPSAARYLIAKGYSVLGVLKGGILRWEHEGLPVAHRKAVDEQP